MFYQGQLAAADIDAIAAHLGVCSTCLRQLELFEAHGSAPDGGILAGLKAAAVDADAQSLLDDESSEGQLLDLARFLTTAGGSEDPGCDRFRLTQHLACGPFCDTFLARDDQEHAVIVRIPYRSRVASSIHRRTFHNDASAQHELQHPNVLPVLDFGMWDQDGVFASQPAAGGPSLSSRLSLKTAWTCADMLQTLRQIAEAVGAAHQMEPPLLHRHLHPANVFVAANGLVQVADFGWVFDRRYQMDLLEADLIDNWYLAPEVKDLSRSRIDRRSDVYSLGSLLAAIGRRCTDMTPDQKDHFRRLALRCRSNSRSGRPADVDEFLSNLLA